MTRRQMYQRGEDQNKQTGFWAMIKSVTSSPSGTESILPERAPPPRLLPTGWLSPFMADSAVGVWMGGWVDVRQYSRARGAAAG